MNSSCCFYLSKGFLIAFSFFKSDPQSFIFANAPLGAFALPRSILPEIIGTIPHETPFVIKHIILLIQRHSLQIILLSLFEFDKIPHLLVLFDQV